ncbi:MAG: hypothetical protein ACREE6_08190 [Limisphaerales bacterium]
MKETLLVASALLVITFGHHSPLFAGNDTNSISAAPGPHPSPKPRPDLLKTCPVSGDKLGEMGPPFTFVYQGREVKLCCPDCKDDFDKNPAKYMKRILAADKKQTNSAQAAQPKVQSPQPAIPARGPKP